MYNKLHYISQGESLRKQLYNIHLALDNGCDWIQLRFKNTDQTDLYKLAETVKILCEEYLATLIINDNVDLAKQLDTDGVHLEQTKMKVIETRELLGGDKIIGGTANSFEDILERVTETYDYISLGPFRTPETKNNPSQISELEVYRNIIKQMDAKNITTPIYAFGGIQLDDIDNLISIGIHGIATSTLITFQPEIITSLNEKLYINI